jgi:broad specificity phosphatase PhoE
VTLTVEFFRHLEAVPKEDWHGKAADRPLSDFGHEQARFLADALMCEPVDGIYRSPAIRCEQSLAPLADRVGMASIPMWALAKNVSRLPRGWERRRGTNGHLGAHAAGSLYSALTRIRSEHPEGRVVVCGHLRTITSLTSFLVALHALPALPELTRYGDRYCLRFDGDSLTMKLIETPGFPR